MINIIVAVGKFDKEKGYPIGKDGGIPWKNKEDMKWFTSTTTGHPVIMGRKTYESIGHPLPKRTNIVVTTREDLWQDKSGVRICDTLESAIKFAETVDEEIFIIGGASIYNQALEKELVDRIYINFLDEKVENADTFFPKIDEDIFAPVEILSPTMFIYQKLGGKNNHVDEQYLNLADKIIKEGAKKNTRAGKTRSLFGVQMRFNLKEGLPLLTTKKVFTKGVIHELLWFLKGETNIKYLVDNDVHIWDDDAYRYYKELFSEERNKNVGDYVCNKEEFLSNVKKGVRKPNFFNRNGILYTYGDLGPVYGEQWRHYNRVLVDIVVDPSERTTLLEGFDQIKEIIKTLKTNPDDRRILLSAWNVTCVPLMALPPCHYSCQFYTKVLENGKRELSCLFNMRSNDFLLGNPYNILSYALLTHLIAQCCDMEVGELIFNGGDTHIYENQIETYEKEQKNRNPHLYALPKLWINPEIKNIDDFTYDDIKIYDYKSYPSVKYPLSVG